MDDVIVSLFRTSTEAQKAIDDLVDVGFSESEINVLRQEDNSNSDELLTDYGFAPEDIQTYQEKVRHGYSLLIVKSSIDTEDDIHDILRDYKAENIKSNVSDKAKEGGPWPTQVSSYQHEISRGGFEEDEDEEDNDISE